jgi:hypothetical protein
MLTYSAYILHAKIVRPSRLFAMALRLFKSSSGSAEKRGERDAVS